MTISRSRDDADTGNSLQKFLFLRADGKDEAQNVGTLILQELTLLVPRLLYILTVPRLLVRGSSRDRLIYR